MEWGADLKRFSSSFRKKHRYFIPFSLQTDTISVSLDGRNNQVATGPEPMRWNWGRRGQVYRIIHDFVISGEDDEELRLQNYNA